MEYFRDLLHGMFFKGDNMKKSHKGCCRVFWKSKLNGEITWEDGLSYDESMENTLMIPIFRDGKFIENLGTHNPLNGETKLDEEEIDGAEEEEEEEEEQE